MITQFFSIAIIALLGAMLPGPDFAIVTKNSLFYSKKAGFLTAFGVGAAILVHMSYCVLGLAIVISRSLFLFNLIKYVGACYLIYLGVKSLQFKEEKIFLSSHQNDTRQSHFESFKQGFLCNLLNPKATLFFLSLFTVLIKPTTPLTWQIIFAIEIFSTAVIWFCCLTFILSHPSIKNFLQKIEKYIAKILGLFLIGFGITLAFLS